MKKMLVLVSILALASFSFGMGWTRVGGMSLTYDWHPALLPAGSYEWTWGTDNGDGTVTYGAFTFSKYGGTRYGILEVDNSIDSYDAYITQTITTPAFSGTNIGQQFLNWGNPTGGTTDVWIELSYNSGADVDHYESTATGAWQTSYYWVSPAVQATEMTVKIGLVKDPGTTTGTRSLIIEDALLWCWTIGGAYQWENYLFDLKPDWRENLIALKPSENPLMVEEEGPTSTTYEAVCVDDVPVSNVTVTVTPDNQTEINSQGAGVSVDLTFTPGNYNAAQTVTITAIDDPVVESNPHTSTITHSVNSGDTNYDQAIVGPLTVNVEDDDVEGVKEIFVTVVDPPMNVAEEGETTETYTIHLGDVPSSDVTITATRSSDDVTLDIGGGPLASVDLVFNAGNYDTPQTITVKAVDDALSEGIESVTITHVASGGDAEYNALSIDDVSIFVEDNEIDCSDFGKPRWPDPNNEIVNLKVLADLASVWLSGSKSSFYNDAPLDFRGIITSPYDYGRAYAKDFSFTTDWENYFSEWSQEGYNTTIYLLSREFSMGIQAYLRLEDYPEAREISDALAINNINLFKVVLALGKSYGFDNYLYTGTVVWTPAFGAAHGLDQTFPVSLTVHTSHNNPPYNSGIRSELTRAYTESLFAECARTYEDLDGFYGVMGESLPGRKSTWFTEAIAPGLACTGSRLNQTAGRQGHKPLFIAHQWHVPLDEYIEDIVEQDVYDNVWLGIHAYNSEIIADARPWPHVNTWAKETGLPTVVMIYPANIYNMPFNSPKFASEIIEELKMVPNIKGFIYWDWGGKTLSPLFRKGLAYYSSRREEYSDEPWLDILENQFGTRQAAQHFLNAFNISSRIIPETCALVYGGHDNIRRELQIPLSWFMPGSAPYAWNTSNVRGKNLVPVWFYSKMVKSNPTLFENANGADPTHVTGAYSDYRQIPIWRTYGGSSFDIIPPVHMAKVAEMGQECYDEATLGKAAATASEPYQTEAQNMWMFMKGYKLLSQYYESKVNAATAGIIYKLGGSSVTYTQAQNAFDTAYNDFVAWYNFVKTESPKLNDVMRSIYGVDIRDDNLGGNTMDGHLAQELNDKTNWQSIFDTYYW